MKNIGRAKEGDTRVSLPRAPRSFSRHDIFMRLPRRLKKERRARGTARDQQGENATRVIGTPGAGKRETGAKQNKF